MKDTTSVTIARELINGSKFIPVSELSAQGADFSGIWSGMPAGQIDDAHRHFVAARVPDAMLGKTESGDTLNGETLQQKLLPFMPKASHGLLVSTLPFKEGDATVTRYFVILSSKDQGQFEWNALHGFKPEMVRKIVRAKPEQPKAPVSQGNDWGTFVRKEPVLDSSLIQVQSSLQAGM